MANRSNTRSHFLRVGGLSKSELLRQLAEADISLNALARKLFEDARFITTNTAPIKVVLVTLADLGFSAGTEYGQIVAQAASKGLSLCSLELAVHLRLHLTDQAEGAVGQPTTRHRAPPGSITVASPAPTDEEFPWGFYLRRIEGTLWLRGYSSWSRHLWSPQDTLAFSSFENAG